jgi:betaine-aldehyde dehydrogenase
MDMTQADETLKLPTHRGLYYGGAWHDSRDDIRLSIQSPGTGELLAEIAGASSRDMDAAVAAAHEGFTVWKRTPPRERGAILNAAADLIRSHGRELALVDAADSGNPVSEMLGDAKAAAAQIDFFAGLVTEIKGASIPMGPDRVNFSVREPMGVVARIIPFNHPLMFCAGKSAAILAAGNAVIVKPPEQAPLSSLRLAELIGPLFPAGVFNVVPAERAASAHLAGHQGIAKVALVGSAAAGRAVMQAAAHTIKPVLLELGGKNALIAFPDMAPERVADAVIAGMNFGWCGQSCGSTSRAFLHEDIHDATLEHIRRKISRYKPGLPTNLATTMGAIISKAQHARVVKYIEGAKTEGARLVYGGNVPTDRELSGGNFLEPTVFADVTPAMAIAQEEIFGPVLSIFRWRDYDRMMEEVNRPMYGLTCAIWTRDLLLAHRTAQAVQAGFVWVNDVANHFLGASFGGYKQSGIGREESIEELFAFSNEKNIHIRLI